MLGSLIAISPRGRVSSGDMAGGQGIALHIDPKGKKHSCLNDEFQTEFVSCMSRIEKQ